MRKFCIRKIGYNIFLGVKIYHSAVIMKMRSNTELITVYLQHMLVSALNEFCQLSHQNIL